MDQALSAKAAEIAWKQKELFPNILLRMGTFHTICNALSILVKRFRDAGLKDICIEAGIDAEGSINGVLDGKHNNRALRVHKYIYEALNEKSSCCGQRTIKRLVVQSRHLWTR